VLDGANRVTALRKLGYSHLLVQELDLFDPGLTLGSWHHAIERLSAEELLEHAASIPGVTMQEEEARPVNTVPGLARFHFPPRRVVSLQGGEGLDERVIQPHKLTQVYHRFSYFDRVSYTVTRMLLPKRALRFNLQLEMLRAGLSVEEKESWLQQTILEKVADKSIRFYQEPTFFFDE
jgi:hypothetical protein